MREDLSRFRFRKVKSRAQKASRQKSEHPFRDRIELRVLAVLLAWAVGLWLVVPSGSSIDWRMMVSSGVILFIIGFGGQMLLSVMQPREKPANPAWLLMLVMMLLAMIDVRGVRCLLDCFQVFDGIRQSLITPHALVPLLVAMLYGGQTALVIGLITGATLALAADFNLSVFLLSLCSTAIASLEMPKLRYRAHLIRILGRIALWQTPVVLVMAFMPPLMLDLHSIALQLAVLYGWLAFSGLLVLLVLPLAEKITGRIGSISLNAYADLGRPLLQRMILEAPGTYHHVMVVANLAQAAADKIGANGLLARVGAYYHDIGKLGRPQFYMENQMHTVNPHDDLPPNISRMIIINHVKEGMVLARLHHLPAVIKRFIAVHHGTSVIRWFHQKAVTQASDNGERKPVADSDESHYRYSGPLAVTREETIVSLADTIEAGARALPRVTPAHIEGLVKGILNERWNDGQLDQSLLTHAELTAVKQSFVFTLTHLLHARLAYPPHATDADTDTEPTA